MRQKLSIFAAVAILFSSICPLVHAELAPAIFITEVQTSSASSGNQEFIELYNNTDSDIDLADSANGGQVYWQLQYFSSTKVEQTGFDWQTTPPTGAIDLTGTIVAHGYYLLSTSINNETYEPGGVTPDQTYSSPHLSNTAGGVQLVEVDGPAATAHDQVGWSSADPPANGLYASPAPGGSLQRQVDEQGSYINTDGNLGPFVPATTASPKEAWQTPSPDAEPPADPVPDQSPADPAPSLTPPDSLRLSELLPNPASPATDAQDEFIELCNDGDQPVDLSGFTIQTGLNYAYSYTIPDGTLESHAFTSFTSGDTPLALANSGGQARLLNPSGQVVDKTQPYSEAPVGAAWALIDNSWQWTTTPTPGMANLLTLPPVPAPTTKAAKTSSTVKKAAAPKPKKTTSTTSKAKKTSSGSATPTASSSPAATDQPPVLHPAVLAGVGGAALLYGAYEYRTDLANRLYQLRRYRATRRATRATAKGA